MGSPLDTVEDTPIPELVDLQEGESDTSLTGDDAPDEAAGDDPQPERSSRQSGVDGLAGSGDETGDTGR